MSIPMPARVLLALGALHLGQAAVAWACSCTPDAMEVSAATLDDYDQVFVGTARSTRGWSCQPSAEHTTRFEVTEAFQGVEEGEVVKVEHRLDGASCGMEFERGESYLVTAREGSVSLCSPTWLAAESQDDIERLRDLVAD